MVAQKIAQSSIWSSPVWNLNCRARSNLRGAVDPHLKSSLRVPRVWTETDQKYEKRKAKVLNGLKHALGIADIDVLALSRLNSFAGHLIRAGNLNPNRLAYKLVNDRCKQMCREAQQATEGGQGHPGRFSPWNWEMQLDRYYLSSGEDWKQVALDKTKWARSK